MIADFGLRIADLGRAVYDRACFVRRTQSSIINLKTEIFLALSFLLTSAACAQSDATALPKKQRAQQQARAMARELVSGVLDVQLRQLKENNLEKLPIYADIESMRGNLDELVEQEMQDVVKLLEGAQQAPEDKRQQILQEARGKIREVVVSLMAQRQKLYKRMQLAKIAAQVRQTIVMESKVVDRTKALPEAEPTVREQSTLNTLEDQRDVATLYNVLLSILDDVSQWEGQVGGGAAKGLRLVKSLRLDAELQQADEALSVSKYAEAERAELAVIKGLKALLEIIEETQGLAGSDRESVARMVEDILRHQEQLREKTKAADLSEAKSAESLAQEQHAVHQELGELAEALRPYAATESLAEQAQAAAYEAESKLFEGEKPKAVQEQGQVIGALAEIAKKLEQAAESTSDMTAEQLAQKVQQLEKLDQALTAAREKQNEVAKHAAANAPAAKANEDQVAQQLAQANQAADFGAAIETRLADAQDALTAAQQALQNPAAEMAAQRTEAAQAATQAIDHAATEVKQELADTRRKQLAVKVGELARAAEALERAAAAEREIGDAAAEAARAEGLAKEKTQDLAAEQARVNEVVRDIAEGVKVTAPNAAKQLNDAKPTLESATQQLQAAMQNPGAPSKPAANQAAQSANQGAKHLEQAAATLRKEAGEAAAQLAALADQQLQPVVAARQAVDSTNAELQATQSPADALAQLQRALNQTKQGQAEQLRAAGQSAAAEARELSDAIGKLSGQQMDADRAARDLALGRTSSPLNASTAEQQVADAAEDLADQLSNQGESPAGAPQANAAEQPSAIPKNLAAPIAQELRRAAQLASEAAKEQVIGNPNKASAARQEVRNAIRRAQDAAKQAAAETAKLPAGAVDAAAQQRVTKLADEARQNAGQAAPQAAASLGEAKSQSAAAEQAIGESQPQPAAQAQSNTAAALAKSEEQLQNAIAQLAKQQAEMAGQQATKAGTLADQALPVDAGAAVALQQAESAAVRAAANPDVGDPAGEAQQAVERGLDRAAASLAAREDELRRDASIAEAIAQLAKDQQAARDQIAKQAAKLEELARVRPTPAASKNDPPAPTAEEQAAAQSLAEAVEQFGDAQRATGEGAAEISGQEEVANRPIRQGLEIASQLGMNEPPLPEGDASQPVTAAPLNGQPQPSAAPSPAASDNAPPSQANTTTQPGGPNSESANLRAEPANHTELGTGFVPNSPKITAQQIAGEQALRKAAQIAANQRSTPSDSRPETPTDAQPSEQLGESQQPDLPNQTARTATTKKGGNAIESDSQSENQALPKDIPQTTPADEKRDSRSAKSGDNKEIASRKFDDEPWFAKLPPSLQKAINTKSRRDAPRGYEERLKRYFETKD